MLPQYDRKSADTIYSLCGVASRFATPIVADRWGAKGVMALAFFIQGITVAVLFWTHEVWQFYLFVALFDIGLGGGKCRPSS